MRTEYAFQQNRFSALDYVVFGLVLAIASVIGLFYGCTGNKQNSTAEFLMAGRSMSVLPVALSLLASFMSAILLLGTPAEIVVYGTQYWMICICYFFVIPLAAYVFIPVFYRLQVTSVFEVTNPNVTPFRNLQLVGNIGTFVNKTTSFYELRKFRRGTG